jgi:N-acetylglucosaminyl-diphospho-decaprenol L-rhamnosyltransferase
MTHQDQQLPPAVPDPIAFSVVIVNWNVRDLLRDCLASVERERRLPAHQLQVLVVDNASSDGSVAMVHERFPWVELIENTENVGFGRANNQALPLCRGRTVILLNPDTVVLDGALERLAAQLEDHPALGAVGCRLLNADRSLQRWTGGAFPTIWRVAGWALFLPRLIPGLARWGTLYLERDVMQDLEVDWVSGACVALRIKALDGRLFDERFFMYGEDMDLCRRLKRQGWLVRYSPGASVIHYHARSMAQQSGAILLSSMRGPREFYRQLSGATWLWLYDLLTTVGFGIRWLGFSLLTLLQRSPTHGERARSNRDYMLRAAQILWHG